MEALCSLSRVDLYTGDLVWKTLVTTQSNRTKIIGNEGVNFPLTPAASPVQINKDKEIGVWSFAFIQNGWGGVSEYTGNICGINITKGKLMWTKILFNNASISSGNPLRPTISSVLLKDNAFLTISSDLYIFNSEDGIIFEEKKFDHNLLKPTSTKGILMRLLVRKHGK